MMKMMMNYFYYCYCCHLQLQNHSFEIELFWTQLRLIQMLFSLFFPFEFCYDLFYVANYQFRYYKNYHYCYTDFHPFPYEKFLHYLRNLKSKKCFHHQSIFLESLLIEVIFHYSLYFLIYLHFLVLHQHRKMVRHIFACLVVRVVQVVVHRDD